MGGHRRDQSDSHVPLRQCVEFQHCMPSDSQEQIRIRVEAALSDVESVRNGTINSASSDLPVYHSQWRVQHHHLRVGSFFRLFKSPCYSFSCLNFTLSLIFFLQNLIRMIFMVYGLAIFEARWGLPPWQPLPERLSHFSVMAGGSEQEGLEAALKV